MGSPSPPFYMRHPLLLSSLLSSLVLCSVFASDALEAAFPSPASVPTEECQTFPVSSPLEHSPESIPSPTPAPVPSRFHIQGLPLSIRALKSYNSYEELASIENGRCFFHTNFSERGEAHQSS